MSKRSNIKRLAGDKYYTPAAAILPLLPFVLPGTRFIEPCAGDGRLVRHLEAAGLVCVWQSDIAPDDLFMPAADALHLPLPDDVEVITNPPWSRSLLHPMIRRFKRSWLLFDADWMHNKSAVPYLTQCSAIVTVGRIKWFGNMPGKDNCAWYRFDARHTEGPKFYGRINPPRRMGKKPDAR